MLDYSTKRDLTGPSIRHLHHDYPAGASCASCSAVPGVLFVLHVTWRAGPEAWTCLVLSIGLVHCGGGFRTSFSRGMGAMARGGRRMDRASRRFDLYCLVLCFVRQPHERQPNRGNQTTQPNNSPAWLSYVTKTRLPGNPAAAVAIPTTAQHTAPSFRRRSGISGAADAPEHS